MDDNHSSNYSEMKYEDDFHRSLFTSSTPRTVTRKIGYISPQSSSTTFCEDRCVNTEWEKWIIRKAKEQSFIEEEKKKKDKAERKKQREKCRALKAKQKKTDKVVADWMKMKSKQQHEHRLVELDKQKELERLKSSEKDEIFNKSIVAVDQWKKAKQQSLRNVEEKRKIETERLRKIEKSKKEIATAKYEEWLKNHQATPHKNKIKTLSDFYGVSANVSPSFQHPKPWNTETEVLHKPVRIVYTSFG